MGHGASRSRSSGFTFDRVRGPASFGSHSLRQTLEKGDPSPLASGVRWSRAAFGPTAGEECGVSPPGSPDALSLVGPFASGSSLEWSWLFRNRKRRRGRRNTFFLSLGFRGTRISAFESEVVTARRGSPLTEARAEILGPWPAPRKRKHPSRMLPSDQERKPRDRTGFSTPE